MAGKSKGKAQTTAVGAKVQKTNGTSNVNEKTADKSSKKPTDADKTMKFTDNGTAVAKPNDAKANKNGKKLAADLTSKAVNQHSSKDEENKKEVNNNKQTSHSQAAGKEQSKVSKTAAGKKRAQPQQPDADEDSDVEEKEPVKNAKQKVNNGGSETSSHKSNQDINEGLQKGGKSKNNDNKPTSSKAADNVNAKSTVSQPPTKKQKLTSAGVKITVPTNPGFVLVVGEGDTGQLGLGPDVMDRSRPGRVDLPADVVQVCAGGMHSVCVTVSGEVFTFGCNDEGALGRKVADEDECTSPGKVTFTEKIIMVSAGDSHTAALSGTGHVYICGTFRDSNGPIGIFAGQGNVETPTQIMKEHHVIKIASGCDHLVCLTNEGLIYTLGAAEQGQLGRVAESFAMKGGRRGIEFLLDPALVTCKKRKARFCNVWAGSYYTFAKDKDTGDIYAWGLNNYYQLGIADMQSKFVPEKCRSFAPDKNWMSISGGQHHTLALDGSGKVYSFGRKEYGRLGLGEEVEEKSSPTLIPKLNNIKCVDISSGSAVSYAISESGLIYVWGMGSTKQLGQGDDEEDIYEPTILRGKQLDNKKGIMTSAGGQHTLFLARDGS